MAFTKEEHENLLREIAETGGDTENMLKLMQRLRDDFDEREGMLRKYNEERDKKDPATKEEREEIVDESKADNKEDGGERRDPLPRDMVSREEFEKLKKAYIERFFTSPDEVKEDQEENVKEDGKEKSFDRLFKDKEG